MEVQLNTLFVVARSAAVRRDHLTLQVVVDRAVKLTVPVHQLDGVAAFGGVHVTPSAMQLCAEYGVAVSFLTEAGRLVCRVDAPSSGNVLVRRTQHRWADDPARQAAIARCVIAGKVQNARNVLLRGAREAEVESDQRSLQAAATHLGDSLPALGLAADVDAARGYEGDAGRVYFGAFPVLVRRQREGFPFAGRTRRPPLDAVNALLSFVYGLLVHDCCAALAAAGLDPSVGFLHADRPGRPGLALDLMEEFRPLIADRLVLTLINRQQVRPDGFEVREGGAVSMTDTTRRTVVTAYHQRKREEVTHPLMGQKVALGRLPFLQARVLARHLRGDFASYVPCVLKG